MSELFTKNSPVSVPGVPAGATPVATVAKNQSPGENSGLVTVPVSSPAKFGGNPTGRTRNDGLKSGTPEAAAADRKRNSERMAEKRAADRAAQLPPPLPSQSGASQPSSTAASAQTISVVDGFAADPVFNWNAEDFKQVAPDTIELLEQWRVEDKIQLAEEGKLSGAVVQQIAKDAAFPEKAKRSLQSSSPVALAKLFNAMDVPVTLKAYISTCPTMLYLIVRDFQQRSEIRKLIELSREQKPEAGGQNPEKKS